MAVLVEGISVIIRVSEIQNKISGGWEGFKKYVPNRTLCCDNEVVRIGFMTPDDVKDFVEKLESLGLIFQENAEAKDIAVADQIRGITTKCPWLEFGHVNLDGDPKKRIAACRLAGSDQNQIFTPDGWKFEESLSSSYCFSPTESELEGLRFLRHEGGSDAYLNELTGREMYVGRTGKT